MSSVSLSSTWTPLRLENLLFDAPFCRPRIEGWWTAGEATIIPSRFTGYSSLSWKESYCVSLFFPCPAWRTVSIFFYFWGINLLLLFWLTTSLVPRLFPRLSFKLRSVQIHKTVQLWPAAYKADGFRTALRHQNVLPHLLFLIKMNGGVVVMFRPPTTTRHRQPIFAASTDCVSIADRRCVCVMCTQLHSCWRTLDGWRFQWLRWLVVPVGGRDWELFAVCGCVHARRRVVDFVSVPFDLRPAFPRVCSTLIIKALSAVKWGHGCVRVRTVLPLFTGNFASCLVTGLTRNSGGCLTHWIWLPV